MSESTEMTRFGVHLQVDVESKELPEVGSPVDWEWAKIVDRYIGGDALTDASVRSVTIESTFVVDDDGVINSDTVYEVGSRQNSVLEQAFSTVLDFAQEHVCDNHYKHGGSNKEFQEDLSKVVAVRDFGRSHFHNPEIGDSKLDSFLTDREKVTTDAPFTH